MLEDEVLACPVCGHDLAVKVHRAFKDTYLVPNACPNCKTVTSKLEKMLNQKKTTIKFEKSYIKTDPRG